MSSILLAVMMLASPKVGAETLSLSSAVATAVAISPDLRQSEQQEREAKDDLLVARSNLYPQVNFNANKSFLGYDKYGSLIRPGRVRLDDQDYTGILSATWMLFDGGSTWLSIRQFKQAWQASRQNLEAERRTVELNAVQAFFNLRAAQSIVESEKEHASISAQNAALSKRLYQNGARGYEDLLKAETSELGARILSSQAQAAEFQALAHIDILLGRRQDQLMTPSLPAFPDKALWDVGEYLTQGQNLRPEMLSARLEVDLAKSSFQRLRLAALPTISLSGQFSKDTSLPTYNPGVLPDGVVSSVPNPNWNVGVGLSIPIWDGLQRIETARKAAAEVHRQENSLESTRRAVIESIVVAYSQTTTNLEVYRLAKQQAEKASALLKLLQERYLKGRASILELTDAQDGVAQLRQQEAQAQANYFISYYQLLIASGLRAEP